MKNLLLIGIIVLAGLTACQNKTAKEESSVTEEEIVMDENNMVLVNMDVEGMTCGGCETTIKEGVSALDGIAEVNASYIDGKTYVKVDTSLTSIEEVSETIESKGYHVKSSVIVLEQSTDEAAPGTE